MDMFPPQNSSLANFRGLEIEEGHFLEPVFE